MLSVRLNAAPLSMGCQVVFIIITLLLTACGRAPIPTAPVIVAEAAKSQLNFTFAMTSDVHQYGGDYPTFFKGACQAIRENGQGVFMTTLGDMTPPKKVAETIKNEFGSAYPWYPVVGNHDVEVEHMISWLRQYNQGGKALPNVVNTGPVGSVETSYSFDYGQVHFVVLNQYFDGNRDDGGDGDVVDELYHWLDQDLSTTLQPIKIVMGHEAAFPQPDMENGLLRHEHDSLNSYPEHRDRFWQLLVSHQVLAYLCGHSHTYSHTNIQSVWQINCGHTQGTADTGSRSTFLLIHIDAHNRVICDTYRITSDYRTYYLAASFYLN